MEIYVKGVPSPCDFLDSVLCRLQGMDIIMMKKIIAITIIMFILLLLASQSYKYFMNHQGTYSDINDSINAEGTSITILNDNYKYREGISTDWGFSCYIKNKGKNILFDAASNGYILLQNMEKMNIKAEDIDVIVLSHAHADHIKGLEKILERNKNVVVYLSRSFPDNFEKMITDMGARVVEVSKQTYITDSISITEVMHGQPDEQALVVEADNGLILITGCSHPGIDNITAKVKAQYKKEILLAMGGFHLNASSKEDIQVIIQSLKRQKVKYVAPDHCTGSDAMTAFEEAYKDKYIKAGAGKIILISSLI